MKVIATIHINEKLSKRGKQRIQRLLTQLVKAVLKEFPNVERR